MSIPLSDLGIASYNNTLALNIESSLAQTVYYDQIQFLGKTSTYTEPNQYIGQDFDPETNLSYLHARYLSSPLGQFTSQDPVHVAVGDANKIQQLTGLAQQDYLKNPQTLNSYSYALDNPINYSDPKGLSAAGTPMTPSGVILSVLLAPLMGSYDPVYEQAQYAAENDPMNMATGWVMGSLGPETKTYQVYGKLGKEGEIYIGRTSGVRVPEVNVKTRDASHHMNDKGYGPSQLLTTTKTYAAARGLEQLGQDYANSLGKIGNQIRGISLSNPNLQTYLKQAQKQINSLRSAINKIKK